MATLGDIKTKVRRIVKAPSESQLSNTDLLKFINDFIMYDFPENLRLSVFKKPITFYTAPYVDKYETIPIVGGYRQQEPLYNFKNLYLTEHQPAYIDGTLAYLSQSRDEFYWLYPDVKYKKQIGTGNGIIANFTGTLSQKPIVQNEAIFTSYDADYEQLVLSDVPRKSATTGLPTIIGDMIWPKDTTSRGTINYKTGVYNVTFPEAPASGAPVYSHTVVASIGKPTAMLWYNNTFYVRPVPDGVYSVNFEAYVQPSALSGDDDHPELDEFWSYIAWGASKRILEDRVDMDTLQMIMPMFKEQEDLIQRRTIVQNSDKESATIYNSSSYTNMWGWNNW